MTGAVILTERIATDQLERGLVAVGVSLTLDNLEDV
jgi:hypothetical protein